MSDIEIEGLTSIEGIEKIQDSFLFRGLSFDETRILAGICKTIEKKDGEVIIEENSPGQALYLIVSGEVIVLKGEGDQKKSLAVLKTGEIFGEMSLIEDSFTSSSVVSKGVTRLLTIDKRDLEQIMEDNDLFAAKIYRSFCIALSERLRKANQKLKEVDAHG
jgi:CRP-like cAMP-binding protein